MSSLCFQVGIIRVLSYNGEKYSEGADSAVKAIV